MSLIYFSFSFQIYCEIYFLFIYLCNIINSICAFRIFKRNTKCTIKIENANILVDETDSAIFFYIFYSLLVVFVAALISL